jgi:hypothetical protein
MDAALGQQLVEVEGRGLTDKLFVEC